MCTHSLDLQNWELFSDNRKRTKALLLSRLQVETFESRKTQVQKPQSSLQSVQALIQAKKPLQKIHQPLKGWLARKPIHSKGSVSLPTQYKNRKLDVLYLIVEGDFTPLLARDAYLNLKVSMNLLIDTAEPHTVNLETSRQDENQSIFKTDPVVREYQDFFSDNSCQPKCMWRLIPRCLQQPTRPLEYPLLCQNQHEKSSRRWEKKVLL